MIRPLGMLSAVTLLVLTPAGANAQAQPDQSQIQELQRRIEALERILAPVIGQAEQNQRNQQLLSAELKQLAEQTRLQIAALQMPAPVASPPPVERQLSLPAQASLPRSADTSGPDYLTRARTGIGEGSWAQAEFDASAQLAIQNQPEKVTEATYLLGRSLLGQGHMALAAEKFLSVYDSKPAPALAAENMFYLGEALRELGLPDKTQLCAVYAETLQDHGAALGAERVAHLRQRLAEQQCS